MLANEYTKKRRFTTPAGNHVLNQHDSLYGIDPAQINIFDPPPAARTYEELNQDVMVAANSGQTDGDVEDALIRENCYTPVEVMSKAKQEKLSRDTTTKLADVEGLDEAQIKRFIRETSHLQTITHPDVVHDIISRVFSPTVIMTISNACENLPFGESS
jgi:hypothetical protein